MLDGKLPTQVCGHLLASHGRPDSPAPVPTEFSAELFFPEGVSASLYCSFLAEIQQWANVSGTKGFIHVPDFVLPHYGAEVGFEVSNPVFHVAGCDFNMEDHRRRVAVHEYSNGTANSQEANMFRTFAALALSGRPDESWGAMVLKTQQVLDACLQSAASARSNGRVGYATGLRAKEPPTIDTDAANGRCSGPAGRALCSVPMQYPIMNPFTTGGLAPAADAKCCGWRCRWWSPPSPPR